MILMVHVSNRIKRAQSKTQHDKWKRTINFLLRRFGWQGERKARKVPLIVDIDATKGEAVI